MAPTKPLVAQQINACYDIMGIPHQDTAEMTGIYEGFFKINKKTQTDIPFSN